MSDEKTAGSVEALRYEIDEDGSIYRHDAKEVQVWISLNRRRPSTV